jgi:hypothetical protein
MLSTMLNRLLISLAFIGYFSKAGATVPHHALIVGVGQYSAASENSPLLGVPKDVLTARRMTQASPGREAQADQNVLQAPNQRMSQRDAWG